MAEEGGDEEPVVVSCMVRTSNTGSSMGNESVAM
jgi:hypothetical protein